MQRPPVKRFDCKKCCTHWNANQTISIWHAKWNKNEHFLYKWKSAGASYTTFEPEISGNLSLSCWSWPSNCRRKNNHFGIFACSSRTRSPTDGQPWMDWLWLLLELLLRLLLCIPESFADTGMWTLLLASYWNCRQTILKLKLRFWSCCTRVQASSDCLFVSLSLSVSLSVWMSQGAAWVPLGLLHKQSYCQVSISGVSNFVAFR